MCRTELQIHIDMLKGHAFLWHSEIHYTYIRLTYTTFNRLLSPLNI